jgi:hypothetical protein
LKTSSEAFRFCRDQSHVSGPPLPVQRIKVARAR